MPGDGGTFDLRAALTRPRELFDVRAGAAGGWFVALVAGEWLELAPNATGTLQLGFEAGRPPSYVRANYCG